MADLYATFETSMGNIEVKLFEAQAPKTVANFVGLAEGTKQWKDPGDGQTKQSRFYDGLIFHRVIPDFMIQGGCPLGRGTGGPGYRFEDEIDPGLKFDRPGLLAMANAGPNTNGSQFFLTEVATTHLTGLHTIFGEVLGDGLDLIKKIARVPAGPGNKPNTPVTIDKVTITRK
jgi:peptidyl-prolyl cis-trans isomerase A (cyclophilin A)